MQSRYLCIVSAACLVAALVTVGSKWQGNAGLNAGSAASAWKIEFCGSVSGWPAMFGELLLLAGIVLFVVALIKSVTGPAQA